MGLIDDLADLVLPQACVACRVAGSSLCVRCRSDPSPVRVALHVGQPTTLPVAAAGWYRGAMRQALLAYKERGRRDLAGPLGDLLGAAVCDIRPPPGTVLVGAPSTRSSARIRGGDHVLRLSRVAGRRLRLTVRPALSLRHRVRDSAGLTAAERATNLAGAMVAERGHGRPVVLVDDIATTGATIRESLRALAAAGWRTVGVAVVAATQRRGRCLPDREAPPVLPPYEALLHRPWSW